jgi:hypothetical protein
MNSHLQALAREKGYAQLKREANMRCDMPTTRGKRSKPWMPRPERPIPGHRVIKSAKAYDRRREKDRMRRFGMEA